MRKAFYLSTILAACFLFSLSQAYAECSIVWSGTYSYYNKNTVNDNGSVATNETSRTLQAAQELFTSIGGIGCLNPSSPSFSTSNNCYGFSDPPDEWDQICERWVCLNGTWDASFSCPGNCGRSFNYRISGAWDVVCTPTLVTLSSFIATPKAGKVILQWSTEAEIENASFNIFRAESENSEYRKINTPLIPAQGTSTQGASYEFVDTNVQNRKTYYYRLEDIDLNGKSTMHEPVSATPRLIYRVGK